MRKSLPGTVKHQQMLETILNYYAEDKRILAVIVFGSLGGDTWDEYSDLDLDIVTTDGIFSDARIELKELCEAIKAKHDLDALIIADREEGDVVLSNLLEFSIRYHPLHDTKPAILDTMQVLASAIPLSWIQEAGEANRTVYEEEAPELSEMLNQAIRYALELHNAIQRNRLWMCLELLHRIRNLILNLYTISHDGFRVPQYFEANAPIDLQEKLKQLVPNPDMEAIKIALRALLYLLENDLDSFSQERLNLNRQQQMILEQIKSQLPDI